MASSELRRAVTFVAAANLCYFGVEFSVAVAIGSVALFADSIDFLEDAALNLLIVIGLGWSVARRAQLGIALAFLLLVPGVATLWTAWQAWQSEQVPEALPLSLTGLGALAVNLTCAWVLARVRHEQGSLTKAAFLSARNDAVANVAIVVAGGLTVLTASRWPDLIVGFGILLMNLDAAHEVYAAARAEQAASRAARA
jgi:Co/Zn/Cd efflux system component